MGGASFFPGCCVKPNLSVDEQVTLLVSRGLAVDDKVVCAQFLAATNYYRFSGYARYFQQAPHLGNDDFRQGTTFDEVRAVYDADEALRTLLVVPLARVELMLRSHVARVIAEEHGAYGRYLEEDFYTDISDREPTVESCLRDIERSKDRYILRYRVDGVYRADYSELPVWSAVEAWSFGTLSKVIERGGQGTLSDAVATSAGIAKAGFAYRVRASSSPDPCLMLSPPSTTWHLVTRSPTGSSLSSWPSTPETPYFGRGWSSRRALATIPVTRRSPSEKYARVNHVPLRSVHNRLANRTRCRVPGMEWDSAASGAI